MSLRSSGRFKIGGAPAPRINTRAVRFRLTAAFASVFSLLLIGLGAIYRQNLAKTLDAQIRDGLEQEWAAAKGYLRIERDQKPIWYYDPKDPNESLIVERIRRVYMLTNDAGNIMQISVEYEAIGPDSPVAIAAALRAPQPGWHIRKNAQGASFLILSGAVFDESHDKKYFLAIGRSLGDNRHILEQFTWTYIVLIPVVIMGGCLLGWVVAGRALTPVLEVAQTAQRISGSNLSLRIPTRGARDELHYLIDTFYHVI